MSESRRVVSMSVLPGEPLDGSGRVAIHLFIQDEKGPFVEPHVLHPVMDGNGEQIKQQVIARPSRGRLACSSKRNASPVVRNGVTIITLRTDDPNAVTCPKCLASVDYTELINRNESVRASMPGAQ